MARQLKPAADDDDEQESSAPLFVHQSSTTRKTRSKNVWLAIGAVVLVMLVLGLGFYVLRHHHTAATATTTATVPASSQAYSKSTTQYVSNGQDLNLSLSYPSNWTVTPPTNNNPKDQPIVLTSPLQSLPSATAGTITGKVVVSIRPASAQINELASGNATVAQNSVQIAYSNPTASQHQYPYLTFIHLSGGSNPSGVFEEVMLTGVTQFSKDQPITSDSLGQLDPIVSASFYRCTTKDCSGSSATALSITNDAWQNNSAFQQIQTLLQFLQFH